MPAKYDAESYRVVKHPVRRRIIELLGLRGSMSFTELKSEMNLAVGTLYYHLDVLDGYVVQDDERRYVLSREGRRLYEMIASGGGQGARDAGRTIFIPSWFFTALEEKPSASVACFIITSIVGGVASYFSGQILLLTHYGVSGFPSLVDAAFFPASIIIYMLYTKVLGRIHSGRSVGFSGLLSASIVFTPQIIPLAATIALYGFPEHTFKLTFLALTVAAQVASTVLGASYLSSLHGMRFERALLAQAFFYIISAIVFSFFHAANLVAEV